MSCAFVGRFPKNIQAYSEAKDPLIEIVLETARAITPRNILIRRNATDDMTTGSVVITVSGTLAKTSDDGRTGCGNRANGLVKPRPLPLEASAGKSPVSTLANSVMPQLLVFRLR